MRKKLERFVYMSLGHFVSIIISNSINFPANAMVPFLFMTSYIKLDVCRVYHVFFA